MSQVKFPKSEPYVSGGQPSETFWSKGLRKCKEQPLVPGGIAGTAVALLFATYYLRKGNRAKMQTALRWRVGLQGLTVVGALIGTMYIGGGQKAAPEAISSPDVAGIGVAPGRPLTNAQAQRATEERQASREQLQQRLREMELREEEQQKRRAEDALLGPADRSRPLLGRDGRNRLQGLSTQKQEQQQQQPQSTEKLV